MENRDELIKAAEEEYERKMARDASFREFYAAHFGLPPNVRHEECERIIDGDPNDLSTQHLELFVLHGLGFPPGYKLTKEQTDLFYDHLRGFIEARRGLQGQAS